MRRLLLTFALAGGVSMLAHAAARQEVCLTNPEESLTLRVSVAEGAPLYSLALGEKILIEDSPLGLITDFADFSKGLNIESWKKGEKIIDYRLDRIKKSSVCDTASTLLITFVNTKGQKLQGEFVMTGNDLGFRYLIPQQDGYASTRVIRELTGFRIPDNSTAFLTPQSDAMIGWKRTKPSYEEEYIIDAPLNQKSAYGHGFTFPCLFRVGDDGWVLISETGVDRNYCASHLSDRNDGVFSISFPMAEENNGNGTVEPGFVLPGATPWRTVTVGDKLKPIVETTIPWDLTEPVFTSDKAYSPGKATWSWILWQDESINDKDLRTYAEFARDMGFEYTLIDNWWNSRLGRKGMEDLIRYCHEIGVEPLLWYSSSGYWNDIVQGPVNRMDNPRIRRKEMRWLQDNGVKGIKVDFFGGNKQETMRLYEDILSDADDFGIAVVFHGCTLPRGWEKMYPNYVGSEAVLVSENLIFNQHFCDKEAENATLHPFIRNAVGAMEFGGTLLNHRLNRNNDGGNIRRTTDAFELATAVLFQSPQQNFALAPNNLKDAPAAAIEFMKTVPTRWDNIEFIDGYPGKYVILSRTNANTDYIAGINAQKEPMKVSIDIPEGDVVMLSDGKNGELIRSMPKIKSGKKLTVTMQPDGGFVVIVNKRQQ